MRTQATPNLPDVSFNQLAHPNDLSWINVMGYDLDYANHAPYTRSINDLVGWGNYAASAGVSKSKIVLIVDPRES